MKKEPKEATMDQPMLTDAEVLEFENSKTEAEWNGLCEKIKKKYDGYPYNWFEKIIGSGMADRKSQEQRGRPAIQAYAFHADGKVEEFGLDASIAKK